MARNKHSTLIKNKKITNPVIYILFVLLGLFCFVDSMRQYNNFTIIQFKTIFLIFIICGLLISSIIYFFSNKYINIHVSFKESLKHYAIYTGFISCSVFFITNEYMSKKKQYKITTPILEKHKAYRNSPNYIIVNIEGINREINIHNYSYDEIRNTHSAKISLKKGYWGYLMILNTELK